jgi:hypothetical protein
MLEADRLLAPSGAIPLFPLRLHGDNITFTLPFGLSH